MMREIFLVGLAAHQRVKMGGPPVWFRTQHPAQSLRLFLPRAERAGDLRQHFGVGQVEGVVADFRQDQRAQAPIAEFAVEPFALALRRLARDQRGAQFASDRLQLFEILPDDEHGRAVAYSIRSARGNRQRTSVQRAFAIQPRASRSRHGASYFLGPIKLKTSPSRPSSRINVAVNPSRRRACTSAVTRKTGAGSICTSS